MAAAEAAQAAQHGGVYGPPPQQCHAFRPSQTPESYNGGPPPLGYQQPATFPRSQQYVLYSGAPPEQGQDGIGISRSPSSRRDCFMDSHQFQEDLLKILDLRRETVRLHELVASCRWDTYISGDLLVICRRIAEMEQEILNMRQNIQQNIRIPAIVRGVSIYLEILNDASFPEHSRRDPVPAFGITEGQSTDENTGLSKDNIRHAANWVRLCATASQYAPPLRYDEKFACQPLRSDQNPGLWPRQPEALEGYLPDPWVVCSIIDAINPMRGTLADRESSRGLAYDSGRPILTSTLEKSYPCWALIHRLHNVLGFGDSQRGEGKPLYDAGTWGGDTWDRCKSYAARLLNGAHAIVGNSSGLLTTACLLGSIPHVAGAPHSPGKTMHDRALDIESFMIGLGSMCFTLAPVVIWLATAARLWYILRWHTRELAHPVYSGALATMASVAYGAVRRAVGEPASKEETILAVFVACWTSFVADSRRKVNNKQQYLLRVVFGGGMACLLVTAVQFIDQEPHKVAQQTATTPPNQTVEGGRSFEPGALGSHEATAYLTMAKTNAPFLLIITSVATYIWQMYVEADSESASTTRVAQQ